jgi:hypothetical protein
MRQFRHPAIVKGASQQTNRVPTRDDHAANLHQEPGGPGIPAGISAWLAPAGRRPVCHAGRQWVRTADRRTPVQNGGRLRAAMTINNSLPGPSLRWRDGDTVTLRARLAARLCPEVHGFHLCTSCAVPGALKKSSPGASFLACAAALQRSCSELPTTRTLLPTLRLETSATSTLR